MTDIVTPAFFDLAVNAGGITVHAAVWDATERHRILRGKSARLLRRGDRVALRDLNPDLNGGTAVVEQVRPSVGSTVHVLTRGGEAHLVRGSRLVLVTREAGDDETI